MHTKRVGFLLLIAAYLLPVEDAAAQRGAPPKPQPAPQATADPWYSRQPRPRDIDPPKVFTGAFSIELPKDWQLSPGFSRAAGTGSAEGGTIFSVVQKTRRWEVGALITLQYIRLHAPLDPSLILAARDVELKEVQTYELNGKLFGSSIKTGPLGQVIFIQYTRPGLAGRDDHVVQYSIPVGTVLYRLICIAPAANIENFRPIFAHVAASFTPVKASGS